METARGRSFLEKYARRSRAGDTATLLTAIRRIEDLLTTKSPETAEPSPADAPLSGAAEASPIAAATDTARIEPANADIADVKTEPVQVMQIEAGPIETGPSPVEAVVFEASAIAFLGPDPAGDAAMPVVPANRAKHETRDPFADIRALSEEEKIALFT